MIVYRTINEKARIKFAKMLIYLAFALMRIYNKNANINTYVHEREDELS